MNISKLPSVSGVYIFKNAKGKPIYIGKASNIRKRVKDHFNLKGASPKDATLVAKVKNCEVIQVDSDIESLILEANLIKKFKPDFNSQLKDDKDFLYIKITKEPYPRVVPTRKRGLTFSKAFFGPFPSANKVRTTLKTLRKIFPYSTCKPQADGPDTQRGACLYYHLGLCPGVCVGGITKKAYAANIRKLVLFLRGKKSRVLDILEKQLKEEIKGLEFEKARKTQKRIEALKFVTSPLTRFGDISEEPYSEREEELASLKNQLGLADTPNRIECYDVSNITGKAAVGSMVVFTNGVADKDEYRRFKIREARGINDPAMLKEILKRRFKNDWPSPNLVIVDGGKPQLSAAFSVLQGYKLDTPIAALAKRFEEIYLPGRKKPLQLSSTDKALRLVQRIRDEAHRFAISYHKKLRSRLFLTTG